MSDIGRMLNDYHDPDRYGLNDVHPDNEWIKQTFADYEGPYDLYRSVYKYVPCGPSLGVVFTGFKSETCAEGPCAGEVYETEFTETYYCDDIHKLGTWKDMDEHGLLIIGFRVGSIVEGVDYDCHTIELDLNPEDGTITVDGKEFEPESGEEIPSATLHRAFWKAVEDVDTEAKEIWDATHGCETCLKHWKAEGIDRDEHGNELDWGCTPVWSECPDCGGSGAII